MALDIFTAIAEMKLAPSSQIGPSVSTATGMKWCVPEILEYFLRFLSAAASATAPALWIESGRYEGAKVSLTVASQARHLPELHVRNKCQTIWSEPLFHPALIYIAPQANGFFNRRDARTCQSSADDVIEHEMAG